MMSSPQLDKTQGKDLLRNVKPMISFSRVNKINDTNVWTSELTDKLVQLLAQRNAAVPNFKNVGASLADFSSQDSNTTEDSEHGDEFPRKKRFKTKEGRTNVLENAQQINKPLNFKCIPDYLSFKTDAITGEPASSKRLFLSILPVRNSLLIWNANEKFVDRKTAHEYVKFRSDCNYQHSDEDIKMSAEFFVNLSILPLRQPDGFAGYLMQDTPLDESDESDESYESDESDASHESDEIDDSDEEEGHANC